MQLFLECYLYISFMKMKKCMPDKNPCYNLFTRYPIPCAGRQRQEAEWSPQNLRGSAQNLLYHTDMHKSMGPDGIHPRVSKELTEVLSEAPSIIYLQPWRAGEVTVDWRFSHMMCICRKGWKEDTGSYRLVSPSAREGHKTDHPACQHAARTGQPRTICAVWLLERQVLLKQHHLHLWEGDLLSGWWKDYGYCLPGL